MHLVEIVFLCATLVAGSSDDETFDNEITRADGIVDINPEGSIANEITRRDHVPEEIIEDETELTLDEAHRNSVQAYLDEDWNGCIDGFVKAIASYKKYKKAIIKCRRDCREVATASKPIFPYNIEDLHFYEKKIRETLCLLKCNQDYRDAAGSQSLKRISKDVETHYMQRAPYEYLHICYYQKNRFQDAANAMYTYLVIHPKHEMSLKNLRHYVSLPEVEENRVTNLEAEPFVRMYVTGVNAYDDGLYSEVVDNLENSLRTYLKSEEDCRFYCEGHFDQGWLPEFTPSIANHFTYSLKCKRSCSQWLNNVNGEYHKELLPSHYHYLQFAYHKLGEVRKACEAVASYLLFYPSDETMLENKNYYSKLPQVDADYFTPREEASNYVKRQEYELHLLLSISEEFAAIGARLNEAKKQFEEKDRDDKKLQLVDDPQPVQTTTINRLITVGNEANETDGEKKIRIVADENDLGGKLRYVAEGFLDESECEDLIRLAQVGAVEGDGYEGNVSPHSIYERFEGLTLGRAALMVYFGLLEPKILELALTSSEIARDHVERYFNLRRHLYFTYTHLACRSALPDSPLDRRDLSHAIHADNCMIAENGSCTAEWPAYTFRDYSAILYLNDEFDGGEFLFVDDSAGRLIRGTVEPTCGRMVAFSASGINLHGVRGVRRGKRCALGLWFTFDVEHRESERIVARAIIERVRIYGYVAPGNSDYVVDGKYEDALSEQFDNDEKLSRLYESLTRSS